MAYLNQNILSLLFTGLFLAQAYTTPYKDLNIDFLLEDSTKTPVKKQPKSKKKDNKAFTEVIKDYQKIEGLFTLYWKKENNQAYISILTLNTYTYQRLNHVARLKMLYSLNNDQSPK